LCGETYICIVSGWLGRHHVAVCELQMFSQRSVGVVSEARRHMTNEKNMRSIIGSNFQTWLVGFDLMESLSAQHIHDFK